jgi:hypothetical protein
MSILIKGGTVISVTGALGAYGSEITPALR